MNKWTKANKTMQKLLRSRVILSSTTEEHFGKGHTYFMDVIIHAYRQVGDKVEVSAEWVFVDGEGEKVIKTGNIVIGED